MDFFHLKTGVAMKYICIFLFNCLGLISLSAVAQDMVQPIRGTILLSGNFGELRATHFHSGIDFRTGGVEGLPVICVKNGVVARVSVSPTGYGQALYLEHPDGTTTVYGHLQRFAPSIETLVRELQYQRESFRIDENVRSRQLCFHQGDTIAYSGNSGSSGGPHLHFEVRNTQTEHTLNPLNYYRIKDNRPPVVRTIYLYTISENGCVQMFKSIPVKALATGKYNAGEVLVPAGMIGVGVGVSDYMNDSANKLGIYQMTLAATADELFRMQVDSCAFDQKVLINDIKDFDLYKKGTIVYRCFGNYQNQILGVSNQHKGYIHLVRDSLVPVKIRLADINGNQSLVNIKLKGGAPRKESTENESVLRYDQPHILELPGCQVKLEAGTLLASLKQVLQVKKDTASGRDVFILSEKDTPLVKKGRLVIAGNFDRKAVVCELTASGGKYPMETRWTASGLEADITSLNRYTVDEDRKAPVITYLGAFPDRTLRFRMKDDFTGIADWRGEVNGEWCLFSYDPRVNLLQCSLLEPVFRVGEMNEVKIRVEDKVGNRNEIVVKVKR